MRIRKIKKSDLNECTKLLKKAYSKKPYNENFKPGFGQKYIKNKYQIGRGHSFLIELDKKIIGFVFSSLSYWADGPQAIMEEIVLDEKFRGEGYSKKLNDYLENHFKKSKAKSIMLWVKKDSAAHKFHIKNKYQDANDLSIMFKKLK